MDKKAFFQKFVAFTTAVHQVTHEITKDVKPDDITPLQYSILEYIAVSQPVTLSQISDCQHMSMPNTSRELKKLSEKNLCEKRTVVEDRRKQYVHLSRKGEAIMDEAFKRIEARFLQRIKDASEEELEEINHALDVLHAKVFY
ncbi:DNA-binding MarR family transcriptional regulator [Aneurinibacillus soli]|uniref:HTH-type transcriptional regulator MhqR n=1 Tax=Aneurinibacillus soli TaxID=1500254 RepID=A0A0U4WIP0_9BACL|nr:MarR family transcriptional regulator [Aneurinibacillus soli]PYE61702.1 DNA-binding MarR family transcriptional regulator [Aneurinibacillus soli]BAU28440.1 HTH-type transcriptional regulator MhqR [Aneurinibacillus soli]